MSKTIPLIRAANVLPLVRWMEVNRHDTMAYLKAADLGYWYALSPLDPVPVLNAIELLCSLARDHGPDVQVEIVTQASIAELGFIGRVALGARTPAEALHRLTLAMPFHSTHETLRVEPVGSDIVVILANSLAIPSESQHAIHVLFSAVIQQMTCFTGLQPPVLKHIEMVPHPERGLDHVKRAFGPRVSAASQPAIAITIDGSVAHNPFRTVARDRMANPSAQKIATLAEDRSLAASMRAVIAAMLHGGEPSIERLARAGGTSVRSLQRRLAREDTSFSEQLDIVRRKLLLSHIGAEDLSLAELSERLGYSEQSALTRAVRRLTGRTPSQLIHERTS